jgi:dipeptidyl aminopeptidase/acylaminoacyl peptidase
LTRCLDPLLFLRGPTHMHLHLAVSGAAFEEDLYRCAITNSGVFDWELLTKNAKWDGRPGEYEMLKDHVGKPGKDRDYFESISPLASIDNIKIPVFIAHGKDDNVVNLNQSTKLASGLKRRKIPVETFFPSDELHGFRSPENKAEYYHRIEAFLAKYLR